MQPIERPLSSSAERGGRKSGDLVIRAASGTLEHQALDFPELDVLSNDAVAPSAHVVDVAVPANKRFVGR